MTRCDRTAAWGALQAHFATLASEFDLRAAFARDATRFDSLSFEAPEVFVDLSKNYLDATTFRCLIDLARECGLEAERDAMFEGQAINTTEDRAVLHTALYPTACQPRAEAFRMVVTSAILRPG